MRRPSGSIGNTHPLSYVNFSAGANGASAKLLALDRTFEISLCFLIVENAPWGVLEVSLPEENKNQSAAVPSLLRQPGERQDPSGRVRGPHTLFSIEFVETFVNQVAREYFSHLSAVLK
jgi:hypothetical protein